MTDKKKEKNLENGLNEFLDAPKAEKCVGEECVINTDRTLVEKINKVVVTEDGRRLL